MTPQQKRGQLVAGYAWFAAGVLNLCLCIAHSLGLI